MRTIFISDVLSSETSMLVSSLFRLSENNGQIFVVACWKGLRANNNTLESLLPIYEIVFYLLLKLLKRKKTLDKRCDMTQFSLNL